GLHEPRAALVSAPVASARVAGAAARIGRVRTARVDAVMRPVRVLTRRRRLRTAEHPDAGDVTGGRGIVGLSRLLPRMAAVRWPPLSSQHHHCDHRNGYEDNHPAVPDQCAHTHPELSRPAVECVTRLLTRVDVEDLRALGRRAIDIESVRAL